MKTKIRRYNYWLKYRYYTFGEAIWAKIHHCLRTIYGVTLSINKRTRVKLIKDITFYLLFKIFKLCNLCFERYYFCFFRANHIAKSKTIVLQRD